MPSIAIAIPTYKRAHLLEFLITDLTHQTTQPHALVMIDGDPASGEVLQVLANTALPDAWRIVYLPSNHANLAYQRYLGWRVAANLGADLLVYFDDDQRIYQRDVLAWLARPFDGDGGVVGVGCYSRVPETGHDPAMDHLMAEGRTHWLVRLLGSAAALRLEPGQLTPTGHRVGLVDNGQDYTATEWLQGRIMAYRMSAISNGTFSDDLFALDHIRCGLGEDTFLSRRVGARGKLLYTFRAVVDHPNADTPKSYPYEAYRYAYAATYSRRFLNDYYRVYDPPTMSDRWALVKSYLGNVFLAWMQAVMQRNKRSLALARGTTLGALHGLTRPPTAKNLTPQIDWWADAEAALARQQVLQAGNAHD